MLREDLILALKLITQRMRNVRRFQFVINFLFAYVLLRIAFSGLQLTIFALPFTRGRAFIVALLLAIITVALNRLRGNYRRNGQRVVHALGELNQQETGLVRQFQRY
ncbi:hypothetical protein [Loigolactobacillus jiayinensis]|uniref:Uncharacterized protein n=1 Tax=Loigolactobacillus jiayinensis TaxID=2486016 RepID=A0ABW1RJ54_9LACO|nr:hypothetical protein [Loigolactobacillus jiayinensis]